MNKKSIKRRVFKYCEIFLITLFSLYFLRESFKYINDNLLTTLKLKIDSEIINFVKAISSAFVDSGLVSCSFLFGFVVVVFSIIGIEKKPEARQEITSDKYSDFKVSPRSFTSWRTAIYSFE